MKRQVFNFILAVFFMLAAVSLAWALENGDFEIPITDEWELYKTCSSTDPPGVSIRTNDTVFPSVGITFPELGTSTKTAVFHGTVSSCKEIDAYLKQTVTIPSDATVLRLYYKIKQPAATLGLAAATFKVKLMEQGTVNQVAELFTVSQTSISKSFPPFIDYDWIKVEQQISSEHKGQTYDFYFQFSTTDTKSYEIYFMLDNISFVTVVAGQPIVTTAPVTSITRTGATSGGNVTAEGSSSVTERGICWGTAENPTVEDSKLVDANLGTGEFTSHITGLSKNTAYHVRAYAINTQGTAYGENRSFMTILPGDIYNNDGVNLTDAIISLQINAGIDPTGAINLNNDVDANNVIGLENPIYILQDVAGLHQPE